MKRKRLRHITNARAGVHVGCIYRSAEQQRLSFGGWQKPGQHLHRRRVAAAIGADEAEYLTPLDIEIDVVNGGEVAKPAGQVPCNDYDFVMSFEPGRDV